MDTIFKARQVLPFTQEDVLIEWERGQLYAVIQDWDSAILHYKKSSSLNRLVGNREQEGIIYKSLGAAYAFKGDYENALKLHSKSLHIFRELDDGVQVAQTLVQVGYTHLFQLQLDIAQVYFQQALAIVELLGNNIERAGALLGIGDICVQRREWGEAIRFANQALKVVHSTAALLHQHHAHRLLAEGYEQTGDMMRALTHYKDCIEIEQVWLGKNVREKLRALEVAERVRQTSKENADFRSRAKQLEKEAQCSSLKLDNASKRVAKNTGILRTVQEQLIALKDLNVRDTNILDLLIKGIDDNLRGMDTCTIFEDQIQKHDHHFVQRLAAAFATLTPAELRVCSLLRMDISSRRIADLLSLSERTVDTHRTNIRRKLGIARKQKLTQFLSRI